MSRAELDKNPTDVARMFDGVARRYDLTNTALSGGQDRYWRIQTRRALGLRPGEKVLDLAAGTAVSTVELAKDGAWCVAADFSLGMLRAGARRDVPKAAADALHLPFADGSFDAVTISFGLRNVNDTVAGLREMARVTRPGGRLVVCEFSTPTWAPFRVLYQNGARPRPPGDRPDGLLEPRGLPVPGRVDPGLARPARTRREDRRRRLGAPRLAEPDLRRRRAAPGVQAGLSPAALPCPAPFLVDGPCGGACGTGGRRRDGAGRAVHGWSRWRPGGCPCTGSRPHSGPTPLQNPSHGEGSPRGQGPGRANPLTG